MRYFIQPHIETETRFGESSCIVFSRTAKQGAKCMNAILQLKRNYSYSIFSRARNIAALAHLEEQRLRKS